MENVLGGFVLLVVVCLAVGIGISIFNGLVSLRVRADGAWADIEAQLKRRHDLIPNLVEVVKGYASHEATVLERVTELRGAATHATGPAAAGAVEPQLTGAIRTLIAVAESYPELRANEQFLQLQHSLSEVEDQIQLARRYYNAVVRDLNTRIHTIPSNIIASLAGFTPRAFFELDRPQEGLAPDVRL